MLITINANAAVDRLIFIPEFRPETVIRIPSASNAEVLIDTSGQTARQTISSQPDVLKMNLNEFRITFGESAEDIHELTGLARTQVERYQFPALILTLGDKGILPATPEGNYYAYCPKQKPVNAAGAGDAASAALAWRFSQKESWKEALRWAAVVSAACVLTEGTVEVRLSDVHELLPIAIVEPI